MIITTVRTVIRIMMDYIATLITCKPVLDDHEDVPSDRDGYMI